MVEDTDAILLRISFKFAIFPILESFPKERTFKNVNILTPNSPLWGDLRGDYLYFADKSLHTEVKTSITSSVNLPAFNKSKESLCLAFKNSI